MTSPEKIRQRQRIGGFVLVVLGLFTVLTSLFFRQQDIEQRACLEEKFSELAAALEARGDLAARDSANTSMVILAVAKNRGNDAVLGAVLSQYVVQYNQIQEERKKNPLPAFPAGTCGTD